MLRRVKDWTPSSIGSVAMGHEISATSIQLAVAASVIANGGIDREAADRARRGRCRAGRSRESRRKSRRRIIAPETAIQMRQMMEGVVLHGTGRGAGESERGYTSGGKTGTAQVFDFKVHAYTHRYNASFVGFAPVQNPQIVIAVTMNNTSGGTAGYGGPVAAPVFRDVAMAALRMLDVPKDLPDENLIRSGTRAGGSERPADQAGRAAGNGAGRLEEFCCACESGCCARSICILRHSAAGFGRRFLRRVRREPAAIFKQSGDGAEGAEFSGDDAARGAPGILCERAAGGDGGRSGNWTGAESGSTSRSRAAAGHARTRSLCKMTLGQVLKGVKLRSELTRSGLEKLEIAGIEYDSRRVGKDFLFFAFEGSRVDGRRFAQDAVARGASATVSGAAAAGGVSGAVDRSRAWAAGDGDGGADVLRPAG